jgi:hypothetical protein
VIALHKKESRRWVLYRAEGLEHDKVIALALQTYHAARRKSFAGAA